MQMSCVEGRNNQEPRLHSDPETQCGLHPPLEKRLRFDGDGFGGDGRAQPLPCPRYRGIAFVPSLMNGSKVCTEPGNTSFCVQCSPNTSR